MTAHKEIFMAHHVVLSDVYLRYCTVLIVLLVLISFYLPLSSISICTELTPNTFHGTSLSLSPHLSFLSLSSLSLSPFLLSTSLFSLFSLLFLSWIRWLTRNWFMDSQPVWLFGSKTASTFRLLPESYGVLFLSLNRPVRTNSFFLHYFEISDNNWDTLDRDIDINLIYEMRL